MITFISHREPDLWG